MATAGCGLPDLTTAAGLPDAVEARQVLDLAVQGDIAALRARIHPSLLDGAGEAGLRKVVDVLSKAPPLDVHVVGYQTNSVHTVGGPTTETSRVVFESHRADGWFLTEIVLRRLDQGERRVIALHTEATPQSMEQLSTFSFRGKGPVHYAFLAIMLAIAVLQLFALVAWFRQRRVLGRRWWWLIGILVGPFQISLNWSTGEVGVVALQIHLFCLSFLHSEASPWILSFSIPAGAIVFLVQTRRGWPGSRQPEPPAPLDP